MLNHFYYHINFPRMFKKLVFTFLCIAVLPNFTQQIVAQTNPSEPNILLIIADDMGTDMTPGFLEGPLMPTTPFLNSLRTNGVSFLNCWAAPQCTPTRASIMSGKYGLKTGVQQPPGNLDLTHNSIFKDLNTQTSDAYDQAVIGKWHVSSPHDYTHPAQHEVDYYTGVFDSGVADYYNWDKVENEVLVEGVTTYATTEFTNDAIDWINDRNDPWFLWVSHVAPHAPFHVPPANLYSINATGTNKRKYIASIEAMDSELQRLTESIPAAVLANTIIIFIGDNGTPSNIIQTYPSGKGKGTMYQGGINVPLIVSGPGVSRINETEDALVNATDIFATVLEMAGGSLPGGRHNSYSFYDFLTNANAVGRPFNYIDYESNNSGGDDFAIRDAQYKLIQFADGSQEYYDLIADPFEQNDLLLGSLTAAEQTAFDELELEAVYIRTDWSCRDLIQNGIETAVDVGGTYCGVVPVCSFDNSTSSTNIGCCANPTGDSEVYEIEFEDVRTISTTSFPNHDYCYNSPAQMPNPIPQTFFMDATPTQQANTSSILTGNGMPSFFFGIGMNGVIMAPAPAAPFIFENANTGEFNWNWVFEPTNNQGSGPDVVGLDCSSAHTGGQGYHYHGNMFEYAESIQPGISTTSTPPAGPIQIGWAADGYPILYRFGPDGMGGLALLQPSYEVKAGDRPGDGVNAPCGPHNGKYTNDYQYTSGFGDLDECNGINRNVTLNTVCGLRTFDYFYVITDAFPQIGRCHVGERDETFNTGSETPCLVRMETQELTLNAGESVSVGSNVYNEVGIYCDTIPGSNACDSIVVTKISAILPLSLLSFDAINRQDKWVDLLWETTNEVDVLQFEIERSLDGNNWQSRGVVEAKGGTSAFYYQYQDSWTDILMDNNSVVFYRLRIVDLDGSFRYSMIKSVEKISSDSLVIYHDRDDKSIYIDSNIEWSESLQISILNVMGHEVQSTIIDGVSGRQRALQLKDLPSNMYFVVIQNKYETIATKRIVVAN